MELLEFYRGKKVLVTGHTGFKGSWFVRMLTLAGAQVTGYGLKPPTQPSMFEITGLENTIDHVIGDIRDLGRLKEVFDRVRPEIVFHLAAQPIVRESYREPVYTYETNVMGTVNVLECIRLCPFVRSFVNVTTDKVYENKEWEFGYRENDRLDGYDPYSNSKSCSELVTHSYKQSFFQDGRNPYSLRPFQHVLEPLFVYMTVAKRQMEEPALAGNYNVGPDDADCVDTGRLTDLFCEKWGGGQTWINRHDGGPHEAGFLKLDCSRIKRVFGWQPAFHVGEAVEKTVEWSRAWQAGEDMLSVTDRQINEFLEKNRHGGK